MLRKNTLLAIVSLVLVFVTGCAATRKDLEGALTPLREEVARQGAELASVRDGLGGFEKSTAANFAAVSDNFQELAARQAASSSKFQKGIDRIGGKADLIVKRLVGVEGRVKAAQVASKKEAARLAELVVVVGETTQQSTSYDADATRGVVSREADAVRKHTTAVGDVTQALVSVESGNVQTTVKVDGDATRAVLVTDGDKTRALTSKEAGDTRAHVSREVTAATTSISAGVTAVATTASGAKVAAEDAATKAGAAEKAAGSADSAAKQAGTDAKTATATAGRAETATTGASSAITKLRNINCEMAVRGGAPKPADCP